jgi:hypothetical protein
LRKYLSLALAAGALALLAVAPVAAYAAPGNGATKIDDTSCYTNPIYGWTACTTQKGEYNNTLTPSGNFKFEQNVATTFTFTDPANDYLETLSGRFHRQFLMKEETLQEFRDGERYTVQVHDDGNFSYDCTVSYAFHLVDGRAIYDRTNVDCV